MKKPHVKTLLIAALLLFAFAFCGLLVYRSIHIGYVSRWEKERDAVLPGIVCIGDSLTEGADSDFPPYPKMLETMLSEQICSLPVINLGHGGEDSATILAQAGALELKLHSFTLPGDKTRAEVELYPIEGLDGGGEHPFRLAGKETDALLNPCRIGGVEGYLTRELPLGDTPERFFFERKEEGEELIIPEGEPIIPAAKGRYPDHFHILFVGANGGFDSPSELLAQHRALLEKLDKGRERYLILTTTGGDKETNKEVEEACAAEYGERYLNLREYLSRDALKDLGIEPTKEDLSDMEAGRTPSSLRQDGIHYNEAGTRAVAERVYEKLMEFPEFQELRRFSGSSPEWR